MSGSSVDRARAVRPAVDMRTASAPSRTDVFATTPAALLRISGAAAAAKED